MCYHNVPRTILYPISLQVILKTLRITAVLSQVWFCEQHPKILVHFLDTLLRCSFCGIRYKSIYLALQDFSVSSLGSHAFYVSPSQINTSSIVFSFAYTTPIWSTIRFNFWASSNIQIQLGHFSNINLAVSANSAVVSTKIQKAFGANDNPVVRVFLNGYQTQSNVVQIQVSPSNLEGTSLSVKIIIGSSTQISGVWLSWIAFSPVTASFSAYGGSLGRNSFVGSFSSDVSSNLYQNSYLLYGLSQISING